MISSKKHGFHAVGGWHWCRLAAIAERFDCTREPRRRARRRLSEALLAAAVPPKSSPGAVRAVRRGPHRAIERRTLARPDHAGAPDRTGHAGENRSVSRRGSEDLDSVGARRRGTSFNVDGKFGSELIVSPNMPDEESFWIVASLGSRRDFKEVVVKVLREQHPRCAKTAAASILSAADTWSGDTFHFEVAPLRGLVELAQVHWSFGDGETQSGGARASHSYGDRPQTSETSSFVVTAEVVDVQGRKATARASVSLLNLHYQARMLGGPRVLPVQYDRFVAGEPGEGRSAEIRLNNIEDYPVASSGGTRGSGVVVARFRSTTSQRENCSTAPFFLPARLGATIALPSTWAIADVCRVELAFTGDTEPSTNGQLDEESGLPMRPVSAEADVRAWYAEVRRRGRR